MPEVSDVLRESVNGFPLGINQTTRAANLPNGQLVETKNGYTNESGIVRKRNGITPIFDAPPEADHIKCIIPWADEYTPGSGDFARIIWRSGAKLLSWDLYDPDGSVVEHADDLGSSGTFKPIVSWNYDGSDRIIFSGSGGIYEATADSVTLLTNDYEARHMAVRHASERLFICDAANLSDVVYSEAFDPTDFPVENTWNTAGYIMNMIEFGQVFLVYHADRFLRVDGTNPSTWQVTPIEADDIGLVAEYTLDKANGIPLWLSAKGVAYYDGSRPNTISWPVADIVPDEPAYWLDCIGKVFGNWYMLFYNSDGGMDQDAQPGCDRVLIYNFRNNTWDGPWEIPRVAHACVFSNRRKPRLFLGMTDGNICEYDPAVFTDDGSTYEFKIMFKEFDFKFPCIDKKLRRTHFLVSSGAATTARLETEMTSVHKRVEPLIDGKDIEVLEGQNILVDEHRTRRARSFQPSISNEADCSFQVEAAQVDAYPVFDRS